MGTPAKDEPLPLPYCPYPSAADVAQHGVQPLPMTLPFVDFERARPHRSARYAAVPAAQLIPAQVLQLAKVVRKTRRTGEEISCYLR
jgi:hypothetical protein